MHWEAHVKYAIVIACLGLSACSALTGPKYDCHPVIRHTLAPTVEVSFDDEGHIVGKDGTFVRVDTVTKCFDR